MKKKFEAIQFEIKNVQVANIIATSCQAHDCSPDVPTEIITCLTDYSDCDPDMGD